jgi:hypothetical protein
MMWIVKLKKIFFILKIKFENILNNTVLSKIKNNFYFVVIFLVLIILLNIFVLYKFFIKKQQPSFKKLVSILPVKICYWQGEGEDYFIHEEVPILLKTSLMGYNLIQFILTYNNEIINEFSKLKASIIEHTNVVLPTLNVNVHLGKHDNYFFMVLKKLDNNNESILTSSIHTSNNLIWLEVEGVITYYNNNAKKYPNLLNNINNQNKSVISLEGNLYKYTDTQHPSHIIHMLTEINEFKNVYEQEKQNNILYGFLNFLKEKFVILTKDSRILFMSEGFKNLINLNSVVYTLGDLLEVMKDHNFLPEEMNFKNYINNFKNRIYFCKEIEFEYFASLDGRIFSKTIIPNNNHVMLVYEDVSQQIITTKESIQSKNLQDFYWNHMDEGILVFNTDGNLLFSNPNLKEFVNENYITTKEKFEKNLKVKDEETGVYLSTSIYNNQNFIIIKNNVDNLEIFILKQYKEPVEKNDATDFYYKILREIDLQWRYIDYVRANEINIKKLEQFNFIYKSLHKIKVYTNLNIDYLQLPEMTNIKTINVISFIKNYIESIKNIYNFKNFTTSFEVNEYIVSLDLDLLQKNTMYLLEFFYGFFITKTKTFTISVVDNSLTFLLYVEDKFDFSNYNNTRLLYVIQKLFKYMKFNIKFTEDNKSFTIFIQYNNLN